MPWWFALIASPILSANDSLEWLRNTWGRRLTNLSVQKIAELCKFFFFLWVQEEAHKTTSPVDYFSSFAGTNKTFVLLVVPPPFQDSVHIDGSRVEQEASSIETEIHRRVIMSQDIFSLKWDLIAFHETDFTRQTVHSMVIANLSIRFLIVRKDLLMIPTSLFRLSKGLARPNTIVLIFSGDR